MTNEELQKELNEIKAQLALLISSSQKTVSKYTLYQWLSEWLELYKKPHVAPLTFKDIENSIDLHIKLQIDDINLSSLSSLQIEQCLNKIKTSRMRKFVYHIFNNSLTKAYKLKLINENVMLNVNSVKHKYKNGKSLTAKEQQELLKIVKGTKYEIAYKLYFLTGCRRNEIFLIKWSDIDFEKRLLHIPGTKTSSSDRFIPIFPQLKELLKKMSKGKGYILDLTCNGIKCQFKRLKEKHNLTYSIHSLRHTFATRCLEQGISMKVVQKWLGHSRLDTTANIYTHVLTDFEKKEMEKFKIDI